jgi:hypothetical protein
MLNAGVPVTKQTVDSFFGGIAVRLARIMDDAEQANAWLSEIADSDLTGLGYTADDIAALKDAAYAFGIVAQIYTGSANLPTATDFRVGIRKLAGLG